MMRSVGHVVLVISQTEDIPTVYLVSCHTTTLFAMVSGIHYELSTLGWPARGVVVSGCLSFLANTVMLQHGFATCRQ